MKAILVGATVLAVSAGFAYAENVAAPTDSTKTVLTGRAAFNDWQSDAPGVRRHITPADMPAPFATEAVTNIPTTVARPLGAWPKVPPGFAVSLFAHGLGTPRTMRIAPNGDIFVTESMPGRITILRAHEGASAADQVSVFASGLNKPFGLAFYPPGPDPQYIYVGDNDAILRIPYRTGDLTARGAPETIIPNLPTIGHWTRDVLFSPDGQRMFVAIGSVSNADETLIPRSPAEIREWEAKHGVGSAWGIEQDRAEVAVADPDGESVRAYATGLRNCVGMAIQPETGMPWCAVNERDQFGNNMIPDFVTSVRQNGFYGWPWYYIGAHEDPLHKGERPDLAAKVITPDVLIQPHSAPLSLAFYEGTQFPAEYKGDLFITLHGSYNRAQRTGSKVVRAVMKDGKATGEYEDFMTGFVVSNSEVWGRPVGLAVDHDGALLVSDDANGTIWRVTYSGVPATNTASSAD